MPVSHVQKLRIASRRAKVAHLMLTEPNLSCYQMADRLGMDKKSGYATVWKDQQEIQEEWKQSTLQDFDKAKGIQLARLEKIYNELYKEWERSKKVKTASGRSIKKRLAEITSGKGKKKTSKTKMVPESEDSFTKKEDGLGDPRYMKLLMENVQMQCDLFGISTKNRDELTSTPQIVAFNVVIPESMVGKEQPKQIDMVDTNIPILNGETQEPVLFDTSEDESNEPGSNGTNNAQDQADSGDQEVQDP